MQDPILSAAVRVLGADPVARSWYSQGGSSMQAAQLVSGIRSMGHTEASMADLLEAADLVAYLSQFDRCLAEPGSVSHEAAASPPSEDSDSSPSRLASTRRLPTRFEGREDVTPLSTPSLTRSSEGSRLVEEPSPVMASLLGPEASFLFNAATVAGIDALVALMDACLELHEPGNLS